MGETQQKNFRMSVESIQILSEIALERGVTDTDVIEACVARYAIDLGIQSEAAKSLLMRQIAKTIVACPQQKPTSQIPSLGRKMARLAMGALANSVANGGRGRAGRNPKTTTLHQGSRPDPNQTENDKSD